MNEQEFGTWRGSEGPPDLPRGSDANQADLHPFSKDSPGRASVHV